jgi:hypothetical protein
VIHIIFTLDYEIFGDGTGALRDLVLDPAEQLIRVFDRWDARFVTYVEAAELEKIEAHSTDPAIDAVRDQIRRMHRHDFEIGLHLHPQWCNASFNGRKWLLDNSEYNLCTLSRPRISEIVRGSLEYLRRAVGEPEFTPLCFRAGNWLFQPTSTAASVLYEQGLRVDSSVFKGGLQRSHALDYRSALKNGNYWTFQDDVTKPASSGGWIEVPIYTEMVPFWKMATAKRLGAERSHVTGGDRQRRKRDWSRYADYARLRYPKKLDFCRMTLEELTGMMKPVIQQDRMDPGTLRPMVAIGHTKDPIDFEALNSFFRFLLENGIKVSTFGDIYPELARQLVGERGVIPGSAALNRSSCEDLT